MVLTWHRRPLLGVDLETTGTDVETARIVSAAVVRYGGGRETGTRTWVSDVDGEEIPAEATAVHGWTTEAARAAGRPAAEVVGEILDVLADGVRSGWPLVVMNAPFDLTVLDREARRAGLPALHERVELCVLDPRVLDRRVDRYRSGRRTLGDLCRHWVVKLDGAHTPERDAKAACAVVWKIADRHRWLTRRPLADLHAEQVRWALAQQEDLRGHFARTPGKEHLSRGVRIGWPFIPALQQAAEQ
ncbi:exonuclease domain-containing protein [Streptomyces echinoruber]|uniref:3'-5' exonuclease n=1 Tax=Streptomyces echinoruber TaxID=68898 RepID=A0A918QXD3_9ACTN|nr:exonuclease domain-containing protein [Streptomyces echinoruber]GGZ72845.1 3'-5' exonuclease [Streptomyces echinoruber]